MKKRLKGYRAGGMVCVMGLGKDIKKLPPYFTIELDLDTLKKREKGE